LSYPTQTFFIFVFFFFKFAKGLAVHEDEYLATLGVEQHYVVMERFATRPLSAVVATVGRESSNKTEQRSWARFVKAENQ
jgi:hypothetical protein